MIDIDRVIVSEREQDHGRISELCDGHGIMERAESKIYIQVLRKIMPEDLRGILPSLGITTYSRMIERVILNQNPMKVEGNLPLFLQRTS